MRTLPNYFFEELGIRPSEHMMQQFEQMSSRLNYKPQELGDIKERLKRTIYAAVLLLQPAKFP